MDFDYQYSEEQETFRREVRAWLEENVPDDMAEPVDRNDLTDEQYAFARDWTGGWLKRAGCRQPCPRSTAEGD